ncbi:uncharacterized protein LOC122387267 [Amphibalanus amphitrite]|nr:uncharacterized protein LOC122387267 [Amphibalanus amphitrite]
MTFDYDLDEDINPSDFTFPEFGRRLRREVPREEVFDAEAVRRLEEQWSARQHRRRRALLPGDENHVHDHGAEPTKSCSILGVKYELGEVIGVASDNCLECRCAAQAMFCSPKCCFFALEERLLREGRRSSPDQEPPRPHPLQAYIIE